MPAGFIRFVFRALVLSVACAGIAAVLVWYGMLRLTAPFVYGPVLLFFLLGVTLHYFLLKSLGGRPQQFINMFMGVQALKMLIHLLVLVIIVFTFPASATHFILLYAVYYLVYTVAEVLGLTTASRSGKAAGLAD